jgi:hypothetical protein
VEDNQVIAPDLGVTPEVPKKKGLLTKRTLLIIVPALVLVAGLSTAYFVLIRGDSTVVDESFSANQDEQLDPRFAEADDTVFDYGSIPVEDFVDSTTYDLPTVQEDLSKEFENVVNTSPLYSDLESIYEILDWDDFDKDGDIKEEKMRELIEAAEGAVL